MAPTRKTQKSVRRCDFFLSLWIHKKFGNKIKVFSHWAYNFKKHKSCYICFLEAVFGILKFFSMLHIFLFASMSQAWLRLIKLNSPPSQGNNVKQEMSPVHFHTLYMRRGEQAWASILNLKRLFGPKGGHVGANGYTGSQPGGLWQNFSALSTIPPSAGSQR